MGSTSRNPLFILNNHVSVKDAAEYSGYSVQYLRRLLRSGGLGGLKIGQLWLIEMKAMEEFRGQSKRERDRRFGPRGRNF